MIKPDAVQAGHSGVLLQHIEKAGFIIRAMKLTRLSLSEAERFYSIHKEKPFFSDLIHFMSSGPIIAAVLEKENAVEDFRKLIGNTDPDKAEEGTLRKQYASSISRNAIHGSDSDANAAIEAAFHFSQREIY